MDNILPDSQNSAQNNNMPGADPAGVANDQPIIQQTTTVPAGDDQQKAPQTPAYIPTPTPSAPVGLPPVAEPQVSTPVVSSESGVSPIVEQTPSMPQETLPPVETAAENVSGPASQPAQAPAPETPTVDPNHPPSARDVPLNIVDKRDEDDQVQSLKTSQPLTEDADKEEEEFISHVEEVHTIKQ